MTIRDRPTSPCSTPMPADIRPPDAGPVVDAPQRSPGRTAVAFDALAARVTPIAPTWTPAETMDMRAARAGAVARAVVARARRTRPASRSPGPWSSMAARRARGTGAHRRVPVHGAWRRRLRLLASGMVDLLSADLDGAGEIRAVDAHAVLGATGGSADTDAALPRAGARSPNASAPRVSSWARDRERRSPADPRHATIPAATPRTLVARRRRRPARAAPAGALRPSSRRSSSRASVAAPAGASRDSRR